MSLTRAQWIEMWDEIKRIEFNAKELNTSRISQTDGMTAQSKVRRHASAILREVPKIKSAIEDVIGQME